MLHNTNIPVRSVRIKDRKKYWQVMAPSTTSQTVCYLGGCRGGGSVTTHNWSPTSINEREEDFEQPPTPLIPERTNDVYSVVYNLQDEFERKMYTDQTGKCPTKSYRDMQYIMVLIEMDSNIILVEPTWNRQSGEMVAAYQTLFARLKKNKDSSLKCIFWTMTFQHNTR